MQERLFCTVETPAYGDYPLRGMSHTNNPRYFFNTDYRGCRIGRLALGGEIFMQQQIPLRLADWLEMHIGTLTVGTKLIATHYNPVPMLEGLVEVICTMRHLRISLIAYTPDTLREAARQLRRASQLYEEKGFFEEAFKVSAQPIQDVCRYFALQNEPRNG